jgi:hypothetical protein
MNPDSTEQNKRSHCRGPDPADGPGVRSTPIRAFSISFLAILLVTADCNSIRRETLRTYVKCYNWKNSAFFQAKYISRASISYSVDPPLKRVSGKSKNYSTLFVNSLQATMFRGTAIGILVNQL